jgi:succinylglutamate desuccinylase
VDGLPSGPRFKRWLARVVGDYNGPTFVVFGGLHGNEQTGVEAIEVVREELRPIRNRIRGAFIGLGGNLGALERDTRFIERDLNRRWFARDVEALLERDDGGDRHEDGEQREILDIVHKIIAGSPGEVCILDLHSTSSRSPAFVCMPDALWNHELGFALRVPVILGLEEAIEGTMLGYFSDLGHTTVCFEGGIHGARETLEAHVAAIMVGLVTAGIVRASDIRAYDRHVERLEDIGRSLPRAVEILYRHAISPADEFSMEPGYTSFQPVSAGELVARDRSGQIKSPRAGRMLMPLYQGQGEDGFFIGRDLGDVRMRASRVLRRVGAERVLPFVPGIDRAPSRHGVAGGVLRVSREVGTGPVRDVLRMLGYRRIRVEDDRLLFARRRQRR